LSGQLPDESQSTGDAAILVIDDDQMVRNAMVQLLNSLGYRPIAAASLAEASEQLANRAPIAVLVDHHLGGEDGFAAVASMREQATNGEHGPPLFIGMTGSGALEEPAENQLDGYLVKPFSADQLREVLEKPSLHGT
jgi:CheY-like chemotaxis protein